MQVNEYLAKMVEIQNALLEYVDEDDDDQVKLDYLLKLFKDQKIRENKPSLTLVIGLLSSIIKYHFRTINFYSKIFKIIRFFKDDMKKYYSNEEIYNFFQNKKITLFLHQEKMIDLEKLTKNDYFYKYYQITDTGIYLYPEIDQFVDKYFTKYTKFPINIEKIREIEYSDNYILQLIQKDLIDDFIHYLGTNEIKLNEEIENSEIFETNYLITQSLTNKTPINYAAFFGSAKIFKYLIAQKCQLSSEIWIAAIHGRNPEIIHILEENNIEPADTTYEKCLSLSIKCHHNELFDYIMNNYIKNDDISSLIFKKSMKYHNFSLIQPEMINSDNFYEICKLNYFYFAQSILNQCKNIDINKFIIDKKQESSWSEKITITKYTVLFIAALKGNTDIVRLLLENKDIDVNKKCIKSGYGEYELTPLFIAVQNRRIEIVRLLLENKNTDINLKSNLMKEQQTPLYAAITSKDDEIVKLLINRDDIDINLPSLEFILDTDECTIESYIEATPLYHAASCDNPKIVQLLIDHKNIEIDKIIKIKDDQFYTSTGKYFDPSYREETALFNAVFCKKVENVRILLSKENIDVNFKKKITQNNKLDYEVPILAQAIYCKNSEIIKLLLENKNIDVNVKVMMPPVKEKDPWDENEIKSLKIDLNKEFDEKTCCSITSYRTDDDKSLLHIAIRYHNADAVRLLLENENIDVNCKSFYKSYQYKVSKSKEKEVKELDQKTPLYLAVEEGNYEIVRLLVEHKNTNINMKSSTYLWKNKEIRPIKEENKEEENKEKENKEKENKEEEEEENKEEENKEEEDKNEEENKNDDEDKNEEEDKNDDEDKNEEEDKNEDDDKEEEEEDDDDLMQEVEDIKEEEEEDYKEEEEKHEFKQGVKEVIKEETALHMAVAKGKLKIIKLLLGQKNIDINITDKQGRKPIELNHKEKVTSLFNQP